MHVSEAYLNIIIFTYDYMLRAWQTSVCLWHIMQQKWQQRLAVAGIMQDVVEITPSRDDNAR